MSVCGAFDEAVIFPRCEQAFGRIKIVSGALQPKLNMFFGFHFLRMAALRIFDIIAYINPNAGIYQETHGSRTC